MPNITENLHTIKMDLVSSYPANYARSMHLMNTPTRLFMGVADNTQLVVLKPAPDSSELNPYTSFSPISAPTAVTQDVTGDDKAFYTAFAGFGMQKNSISISGVLTDDGSIAFPSINSLAYNTKNNGMLYMGGVTAVKAANVTDLSTPPLVHNFIPPVPVYSIHYDETMNVVFAGGGVVNAGQVFFRDPTTLSEVASPLSVPDIVFGMDIFNKQLCVAAFKNGMLVYNLQNLASPTQSFQYTTNLAQVYSAIAVPGVVPIFYAFDYTSGLQFVQGNGNYIGDLPIDRGNGARIKHFEPYFVSALATGGVQILQNQEFAGQVADEVNIGSVATAVAVEGNLVAVRSAGSMQKFTISDKGKLTRISSITIPGLNDGDINDIAIDPITGCVYMTGSTLVKICDDQPAVTMGYNQGFFGPICVGQGMFVDGDDALIATSNGFFRVNTAGNLAPVSANFQSTGFNAVDVARDTTHQTAVVSDYTNRSLRFFNITSASTNEIGTGVSLNGARPYGVDILADGKTAVTACYLDGQVIYVDVASQTVLGKYSLLPSQFQPYDVACRTDAAANICYVTNRLTAEVIGLELGMNPTTIRRTGRFKTTGRTGRIAYGDGFVVVPAATAKVVDGMVKYPVPDIQMLPLAVYPGETLPLTQQQMQLNNYGVPCGQLQIVQSELSQYVTTELSTTPGTTVSSFYCENLPPTGDVSAFTKPYVNLVVSTFANNGTRPPQIGMQTVDGLQFSNGVAIPGTGFRPMPRVPKPLLLSMEQNPPYLVFGPQTALMQGQRILCSPDILRLLTGSGVDRPTGTIKMLNFPHLSFARVNKELQPITEFLSSECGWINPQIYIKHDGSLLPPGDITAQARVGNVFGSSQTSSNRFAFTLNPVSPTAQVVAPFYVVQGNQTTPNGWEVICLDPTVVNTNSSASVVVTIVIDGVVVTPSSLPLVQYQNRGVTFTGGYNNVAPTTGRVCIIKTFDPTKFPPGTAPIEICVTIPASQIKFIPNPQVPIAQAITMTATVGVPNIVPAPVVQNDGTIAADDVEVELTSVDAVDEAPGVMFKRGNLPAASSVRAPVREFKAGSITATFSRLDAQFQQTIYAGTKQSSIIAVTPLISPAPVTPIVDVEPKGFSETVKTKEFWIPVALTTAIGIAIWLVRRNYDIQAKKSLTEILKNTKLRPATGLPADIYDALVVPLVMAFYEQFQTQGREIFRAKLKKTEAYIRGIEHMVAEAHRLLPQVQTMKNFFDIADLFKSDAKVFEATELLGYYVDNNKLTAAEKVAALSRIPEFSAIFRRPTVDDSSTPKAGRVKLTNDDAKLNQVRGNKQLAEAFVKSNVFTQFMGICSEEELLSLLLINKNLTIADKIKALYRIPHFAAFIKDYKANGRVPKAGRINLPEDEDVLNHIEELALFYSKYKNGWDFKKLKDLDLKGLVAIFLEAVSSFFRFDEHNKPKHCFSLCTSNHLILPTQMQQSTTSEIDHDETASGIVGCLKACVCSKCCKSPDVIVESLSDELTALTQQGKHRYKAATEMGAIVYQELAKALRSAFDASELQRLSPAASPTHGSAGSSGSAFNFSPVLRSAPSSTAGGASAAYDLKSPMSGSAAQLLIVTGSIVTSGGGSAGSSGDGRRRTTTQRGRDTDQHDRDTKLAAAVVKVADADVEVEMVPPPPATAADAVDAAATDTRLNIS